DFAYAIHTDIGNATIGAKIDGRLVPLDRELQSGETVEVLTSKVETAGPSRDWLDIATTPKARNGVRQWFNRSEREELVDSGRDLVLDGLRQQGLRAQLLIDSDELNQVAEQLNRADLESLFEGVGKGDLQSRTIAQKMVSLLQGDDRDEQLPATPPQRRTTKRRRTAGVHIEGLDDSLVRLARCCNPVRGDEIIGFVTRGRGISVHRDDCANAVELLDASAARQVEADWDSGYSGAFLVSVEVRGLDRNRLLLDTVQVLSEHHLSIASCQTFTAEDSVSVMQFDVELGDPVLLEPLLAAVRDVPGVFDAYRMIAGAARATT
ncbi:MAG: DUF5913 domain-containing protein, partial [Actinomycetota bacterium]|nr:DUF5913 domain-containing protein [Actinomycetota bacterium]